MSVRLPTLWEAPQHTIAKIDMLTSYLQAWFSILGAVFRGRDLWYIDGFAGPGEYTNGVAGSPIAALNAADTAVANVGDRWVAGDIHCVFIEDDRQRFTSLQSRLNSVKNARRIHRHLFNETFIAGVSQLAKATKNPFTPPSPLFAFVDPFGPAGLAFATVGDLLGRPSCEVLVNLDSDGIARVFRAGEDANHRERLNELFGDASWESEIEGIRDLSQQARAIVALYKRKLRALPNVRYVFSFEMRSKKNAINYHLVFASQHPRGLEKMKEAMKSIDQDGSYCFSDDGVGQDTLFRFDEPAVHARDMAKHFAGCTCTYGEINDYALNESPFANPKTMLKALEGDGRIVVTNAGDRKKGTFPERLQGNMRIRFADA